MRYMYSYTPATATLSPHRTEAWSGPRGVNTSGRTEHLPVAVSAA